MLGIGFDVQACLKINRCIVLFNALISQTYQTKRKSDSTWSLSKERASMLQLASGVSKSIPHLSLNFDFRTRHLEGHL